MLRSLCITALAATVAAQGPCERLGCAASVYNEGGACYDGTICQNAGDCVINNTDSILDLATDSPAPGGSFFGDRGDDCRMCFAPEGDTYINLDCKTSYILVPEVAGSGQPKCCRIMGVFGDDEIAGKIYQNINPSLGWITPQHSGYLYGVQAKNPYDASTHVGCLVNQALMIRQYGNYFVSPINSAIPMTPTFIPGTENKVPNLLWTSIFPFLGGGQPAYMWFYEGRGTYSKCDWENATGSGGEEACQTSVGLVAAGFTPEEAKAIDLRLDGTKSVEECNITHSFPIDTDQIAEDTWTVATTTSTGCEQKYNNIKGKLAFEDPDPCPVGGSEYSNADGCGGVGISWPDPWQIRPLANPPAANPLNPSSYCAAARVQQVNDVLDAPPPVTEGDPITEYEGKQVKFRIPSQAMSPVFSQGNATVAFRSGGAGDNWVVDVQLLLNGVPAARVATVDPRTLLPAGAALPAEFAPSDAQIDISSAASAPSAVAGAKTAAAGAHPSAAKRELAVGAVGASSPSEKLTSLRVWAGNEELLHAGEQRTVGGGASSALSAQLSTERLHEKLGTGFVDRVRVRVGADLAFDVYSSPARKFEDPAKQIANVHADVRFVKWDKATAKGALPEMWGTTLMTASTAAMIEEIKLN